MKLDKVYIISHLDDTLPNYEKRSKILKSVVDFWLSRDLDIVICAQNYKEKDFLVNERIRYVFLEEKEYGHKISAARNRLLKEFYESDEDFCIILDDDIQLYSGTKYCDSDNIISILRDLKELHGIDLFNGLQPVFMPFTKEYQKPEYKDNLIFKKNLQVIGQIMFLRNLKKFYGREIYFDENWVDGKEGLLPGEDIRFACELASQNLGVYRLMNIVTKDLGYNHSTWAASVEKRKEGTERFLDKMKEIYSVNEEGKLDYKSISRIPPKILIPKTNPTFTIEDLLA